MELGLQTCRLPLQVLGGQVGCGRILVKAKSDEIPDQRVGHQRGHFRVGVLHDHVNQSGARP